MTTVKEKNIVLAEKPEQIRACFPVCSQLRPHISSKEDFLSQIQRQFSQGYRLAYFQEKEKICSVIGFRFFESLAWGKVLYIDDLITDIVERKKGYAGKLLNWLLKEAQAANCHQIHLDSGYQRYFAHKLYLNHGFNIVSHHFAKQL